MSPRRIILQALLPFAVGYFMSYLLRAVNAVVAPDLVREVGLSPAELGLLTAAYLGAFALFQLPLGVLLDRYGPRRVQFGLLCVAGAGCIAFALAPAFAELFLARAVIGRPEMLVADEPTGNVDPDMASRLLHLFDALNRLGTTIVVATHDLHLVARVTNARTMRLEKGRLHDPTGELRYPPRVLA